MFTRRLIRAAVAGAVVSAAAINSVRAQPAPPPNTPPPQLPPPVSINVPVPPLVTPSQRNNVPLVATLAGIGAVGFGLAITFQLNPDSGRTSTLPARNFPPRDPSLTQLPNLQLGGTGGGGAGSGGGGGSGAGGGGGGAGTGAGGTGTPGPRFNKPPRGETRFDQRRIIVESDASSDVLEAIAQQHNMTPEETIRINLIGRTIHVWRTNVDTPVPIMIDNAATHPGIITGAQPLYFHVLAQGGQVQANAEQYAPQKLHLIEAHRLATGKGIRIAVIDSAVDISHPDLAGAIAAHFRAYGEEEKPHLHGTGMAGAIAARQNMLGVAPGALLLAVSAFSTKANSGEGTTFNILKGIDWAAAQSARVINMSFAGPADPRMREALQKASARGIVLVAAAGNAGPKSPPLYPAADTGIIAVTATNADDGLFSGANRGNYITVAAPGVDVLAPAPESAYQFTTGTSVAAAEVSGVVALLLERNPSLTPAEVRKILRDTAKRLSGKPSDVGAGLVDAYKALLAAKPSS
jgi:hypothetical protein